MRRKEAVKNGLNLDIPQAMLDHAKRHHPAADVAGAQSGSSCASPPSGESSNAPTPTQPIAGTSAGESSQSTKKRPREELTPLSELEEDGEDNDVVMDALSPRKKGRLSDEADSAKGKKPKSRAGKPVKPASSDGVRRSSRKTAKR